MILPHFTAEDADRAHDDWGMNCGPGAIAAICGLTLDELKPTMDAVGFTEKRYTNPTMMNDALRSLGVSFRKIGREWPRWGLVRIQWEGQWTEPGVPMKARYRHTHWIGVATRENGIGVFDINAIGNGSGWSSLADWEGILVPWILENCVPRANGKWHITHALEIDNNAL